jgi:phage terminase large subunit-like protein
MYLAGEGMIPTHNTRTAAEYVKARMLNEPGHRVIVVAPVAAVGKLVCIEGESGLLSVLPSDRVANWSRSLGELVLKNGSQLKLFGAYSRDDADSIRGSQSHTLWAEELATWRHQEFAWDMAMMANRLGNDAKVVVTSTPRPTTLIKKLMNMDNVTIITGSTFDNQDNLADAYIKHLTSNYEGTRMGQQELYGQLLEDIAGAMWNTEMFRYPEKLPEFVRISVAIDPPGGHRLGTNAKCGIVAVGLAADGLLYVLADRSGHFSPEQWAQTAIDLYDELEADVITIENNFGGAMCASVVKAAGFTGRIHTVRASRGKQLRAEPVVSLYEKKRVFHVQGLEDLEKQMTSWVPPGQVEVDSNGIETPIPASDYSPDGIDALVWAINELALSPKRPTVTMSCPPRSSVAVAR